MTKQEDDFYKRLLETFKVEAAEHITAITSGLIELEKAPAPQRQMELIEAIFREAHSLKGAARAVNMREIEAVCQEVESIFASLKGNQIALTPGLFDTVYRAVDTLSGIQARPAGETAPGSSLIHKFTETEPAGKATAIPQTPATESTSPRDSQPAIPKLTETVRISTAKLNALLLQAEELLPVKLAARQRSVELQEMAGDLAAWKKKWARVFPDLRAIEHSLRENGGKKNPRNKKLLEFLQWNSEFVKTVQNRIEGAEKASEQDLRLFETLVDNFLEDIKKVLMLPFSSLLDLFPKFVRDLSRDRGKDVEPAIRGGEIEIDRRILEEIKDPLIHLVRNCIDHGIEGKKERQDRGKPTRGVVAIDVFQKEGGKVEVLVSDDGAGIDLEAVRTAAVKAGVISREEAGKRDDQQLLPLVFRSGVSTSPLITDLSGRGLGLAIVLEKIEKLGGGITMENHPGRGTAFRIVLPVTLATSRGILVRVAEHRFIIPMGNVERVRRIDRGDIKTVENRETIHHDGQAVSLVRLGDMLGLQTRPSNDKNKIPVLLIRAADTRIAFAVDQIENEQEFLVKDLGRQLSRVRNIAAATVLSTGGMVPILNVPDLIKSAGKGLPAAPGLPARIAETEEKRKSVLVVEDSITARTLLKNILEAAGYDVKTAIDGLDAYTTLRTEPFDLVVSDVDMPRMNGFDLTGKIRSEQRLAELPVVLVTALESREDRERGIDVGANAYIVKSSFDQGKLLEVIKRLI